MIEIPFDRCVIFSTLEFDEITDRLASAIHDPHLRLAPELNKKYKHQRYYGWVGGCKFLATRILGHKYFHLPMFLSPTIKGNIVALQRGYEISLSVNLQNLTFVLLLAWMGGLITTFSFVLDKVLGNISNDRYFVTVGISFLLYLITIGYFYFASWRATRFFKYLFVQKLTGFAKPAPQPWVPTLPKVGAPSSATDWIRANLPSFPSKSDLNN